MTHLLVSSACVLAAAAFSADAAPKATVRTPTTHAGALTMTIVYDNNADDPRLQTAWGFACLIEGAEKTILFDTGGSGRLLMANLRVLKIDPRKIDVVVLSHSHADHIGGLGALLRENSEVTIYVPKSFAQRIHRQARHSGGRVVEVRGPCRICRGVRTTGEMGALIKEQSLLIDTKDGLAVVTGCAHPGIVAIVRKAGELTGSPVALVLGGFHMGGLKDKAIRSVIRDLEDLGVKQVGPCHCSGGRTRELFRGSFPDGYVPAGVGTRIELRLPKRGDRRSLTCQDKSEP